MVFGGIWDSLPLSPSFFIKADVMIPIDINMPKRKKRGKKVSNKHVKDKDPVPDLLRATKKKDRKLQKAVKLSARKQNMGLQSDYMEGESL